VKRFGVEQDREFEIAGELFKWVYPYWEDIANVFDADVADITAQDGEEKDPTVKETISDFIKRIELFIDPDFNDGINRWRALSKRKKNPVPHSQYAELYRWLLEVTSLPTPTEPSSPSEDGQLTTVST
jgi:hypothetical protein